MPAPDGKRGVLLQPYGARAHPPLIALLRRVPHAMYL